MLTVGILFLGRLCDPTILLAVRNDMTGAAEKNAAHTEQTRNGLKAMYKSILDDVAKNPAVLVV